MNEVLYNSEHPYTKSKRFTSPWELYKRYTDIREAAEEEKFPSWENFVKAYERWDYPRKNGATEPNHGQFFFKIEKAKATFEDLAIEREHWAKIETYEGENESESANWSRQISKYFDKYCIKPWEARIANTQHSIFDMLMFCHGLEMWKDPYCPYPESMPVDRVFPDSNASMNPEEWDICFVEKRFTLVELYDEVRDEDSIMLKGWNKDAILDLLRDASQSTTNTVDEGIIDAFRKGDISNEYADIEFVIIEAYVKEYNEEENGNRITVYAFPDIGAIKTESREIEDTLRKSDFLRCFPGYAKSHGCVFAVRNHQTHRSYWQCPSYGEMIYVACRFHDKSMNKLIRGAERSIITFLSSEDSNQQNRLANLDDEEVQILNPSEQIIPQRLGVDISQLSQVLRQVMIDVEAGVGEDSIPGSQNVKGRPITASEAQIRASSSNAAQSNYIRSFIRRDTAIIKEIYQRFLNLDEDGDSFYEKNLKRFLKKMKQLKIPAEAFDYDNVLISSTYSLNAGSPQQKVTAANMKLQLVRQYHNSTSEGERRIIKEAIAALDSWDNVDYYLDNLGEIELSSIAKAGRENEIMNNAYLNRANVQVMSNDKHFSEVPVHLNDIEFSLNAAESLLYNIQQSPAQEVFIRLDEIADMLVGIENKSSHVLAHLQMAAREKEGEEKGKVLHQRLGQYQGRQQRLESVLKGIKEKALASSGDSNMQNLEYQHKARMFQLEEQHAATMNQVDLGKSVQKTTANLDGAEERHSQQLRHKEQDHALNVAAKVLDSQVKKETKDTKKKNESTGSN